MHVTEEIPYRHTLVQGVPVPGIINPDLVAELQSFEFKDGDVVVASYQKAGEQVSFESMVGAEFWGLTVTHWSIHPLLFGTPPKNYRTLHHECNS